MNQRLGPGGATGRPLLLWSLLVALPACSPAFDWRQSEPEASGVSMLFPCRPERQERPVRLGEGVLKMQMHACKAAGAVFSLAVIAVTDPAAVTPLLAALRERAVANIDGTPSQTAPASVNGATPNPESVTLRIDGRLPDGRPVVAHAAFFVKGLRLYQATVLGEGQPPAREPLENFFGGIRLR